MEMKKYIAKLFYRFIRATFYACFIKIYFSNNKTVFENQIDLGFFLVLKDVHSIRWNLNSFVLPI